MSKNKVVHKLLAPSRSKKRQIHPAMDNRSHIRGTFIRYNGGNLFVAIPQMNGNREI